MKLPRFAVVLALSSDTGNGGNMNSMKIFALAVALCAMAQAACSGASNRATESTTAAQEAMVTSSRPESENTPRRGVAAEVETAENTCVANLPFSRGRRFCCLDEYLAYLELQGAIDLPWWRQIGPGLYERIVRMPGAARETATREELMRLYGFSC